MLLQKVLEQMREFLAPAKEEPSQIIIPRAVLVPVRARRITTQRNIRPRPYL